MNRFQKDPLLCYGLDAELSEEGPEDPETWLGGKQETLGDH